MIGSTFGGGYTAPDEVAPAFLVEEEESGHHSHVVGHYKEEKGDTGLCCCVLAVWMEGYLNLQSMAGSLTK